LESVRRLEKHLPALKRLMLNRNLSTTAYNKLATIDDLEHGEIHVLDARPDILQYRTQEAHDELRQDKLQKSRN